MTKLNYAFLCAMLLLMTLGTTPNSYASSQTKIAISSNTTLYGTVCSTKGKPIKNVVVSDGYSCAITDKNGIYQIARHPCAKYVFVSIPSGYEATTQQGYGSYPNFYAAANTVGKENSNQHRVDFELCPLTIKSKNFTLYAVGDPQSNNDEHIEQFRNQTMADIKASQSHYNKYAVGIALGDVVGIGNKGSHFKQKSALGSTDIEFRAATGNHDKDAIDYTGEAFSDALGPLWYSFNVGDVHFVCLDNINSFDQNKRGAKLTAGFCDEQTAWLQQDLSHVSKDKMVVLYYHIPERNHKSHINHDKVFEMISHYSNPIAICGHTHYYQGYNIEQYGVYEYILGAACGYFWRSECGVDGTPNGYVVFEIEGNKVVNSRFKATAFDKEHQIRMYRGNSTFGGERAKYSYGLGDDVVIANLFFANMGGKWSIEVYEDDTLSGEMEQLDPTIGDLWIRGYHTGVKSFPFGSSTGPCHHLFKYTLKNPNANVTIKATDIYGNVYIQSKFTAETDFTQAVPKQNKTN